MDEMTPLSAQPRALSPHLATVLDAAVEHQASDVHVTVGVPPVIRVDGRLKSLPNEVPYSAEAAHADLQTTLLGPQASLLAQDRQLDFSFGYGSVRIRANLYYERGHVAGAFRLIPTKIRTLAELGLPPMMEELADRRQGLIVFTGPAGHGKTTSMAALVDHINTHRSEHIITVEDPIEYLIASKRSIVSQRELGSDTPSFAAALKVALRQDPNVLLVGEMRDLETIQAVLTLAETGHLIFSTLHTNSAAQTPDRMIDVFPPHQQDQVRSQLAQVLLAVVSQRLLPKVDGGLIVAAEVLLGTNAVRATIREGKTHQLENVIRTGAAEGMIGLDKVLADLVSAGEVAIDDAVAWANDPKQLKMNVY